MASGLPIKLATTDSLRFEIGKLAANMILERNEQNITNTAKTIELETSVDIGTSI
jgi:LacI family gluconate utilization system Gnt-I transcriptional repressor